MSYGWHGNTTYHTAGTLGTAAVHLSSLCYIYEKESSSTNGMGYGTTIPLMYVES